MHWDMLDTWTVAIAALVAVNCALLGNFLVLRRLSMMGDAISHSVLPGIAIALWIAGGVGPTSMFIGAAVVGVLTAVLIQAVHRGGVEEGASMGVVFTSLFAIGLILMWEVAKGARIDLDPDCVLFGQLAAAPLSRVDFLGMAVPRTLLVLGMVLVVNVGFVAAFYKELRLTAFDPQLADALGFRSGLMHYATMTLVAMTCVAAFESVGSILVVALLIAPPATALLLTRSMGLMVLLSVVLGIGAAVLGHFFSTTLPESMGHGGVNGAGMTAVVAGGFFVLALVAEPNQGLVARGVLRWRRAVRIAEEDVLGVLLRREEWDSMDVQRPATTRGATGWAARRRLVRSGRVRWRGEVLELTETGREAARSLLRSHRLWERYMADRAGVRPDHTHRAAEALEHVTDEELQRRLAAATRDTTDPHGRPIP